MSWLKAAGDAPLSGTVTLPAPPRGVVQRRLTFTHHRAYPGLVNVPRHWVRCRTAGYANRVLMRDDTHRATVAYLATGRRAAPVNP